MSVQDYMKTFAPPPEELKAMQATAKRNGTNKLTPSQNRPPYFGCPERAKNVADETPRQMIGVVLDTNWKRWSSPWLSPILAEYERVLLPRLKFALCRS